MDESVKRRVVGASVLALAGVILLPWLFGDPKDPRSEIRASFSGTPLPPTATARPAATAAPAASPATAVVAAHPPPVATPAPAPDWVIQLASYRQPDDAEAFLARLKEAGHDAYRERVRIQGRTYYRVRLGVRGSRAAAERLQRELEKRYRLKAQLLSAR